MGEGGEVAAPREEEGELAFLAIFKALGVIDIISGIAGLIVGPPTREPYFIVGGIVFLIKGLLFLSIYYTAKGEAG